MSEEARDRAVLALTIAGDLNQVLGQAARLGAPAVVRAKANGLGVEVTFPGLDAEAVPSEDRWELWTRVLAEEAGCSRDAAQRAIERAMAEGPGSWDGFGDPGDQEGP